MVDLQIDLNALSQWCKVNGINANTDMTKVMVFGSKPGLFRLPPYEVQFDNTPLSVVTSYKYLGITIDNHLNYNKHIQNVITNVSEKFQRMKSFLNIKAALKVYKSTMLPILEYADIFLGYAFLNNRKKMQILQNNRLRCALNKGIETSRDELHREAKLLKLKFRRKQHLLNYMYEVAQNENYHIKKSSMTIN